jgi:hypothetical protein
MTEVGTPETASIEAKVETLEAKVADLTVADDAGLEAAGYLLGGVSALIKEAEGVFDPPIAAAHASHKAALAAKKKVVGPLAALKKAITAKVAAHHDRVRREQARIEAERRAAEQAEIARLKKEEEDRIAAAIAAEEEGDAERADAILDDPEPVDPTPVLVPPERLTPPPPAAPAKVAGMVTSKVYSAEVTDRESFIKWAVRVGRFELLSIESGPLNALARAQKESFNADGAKLVVGTRVTNRR